MADNADKLKAVILKIQKIMELAGNNPNEHEAASAAEKAQAMLAEYNLTMADIMKAGEQPMSDMCLDASYKTDSYKWRLGIGTAVAQLYFCAYFFRPVERNRPVNNVYHCFAGERHNVAVATLMFRYLVETINRLAREGAKSLPDKERSPYRTTFRQQAALTLRYRLIERKQQAEEGNIQSVETGKNLPALLSMYEREKQKAEDFIATTVGKLKTVKAKLTTFHEKGMEDGREAGKNISLDTQIGGQQKPAGRLTAQ